jgi:hypothetical protein
VSRKCLLGLLEFMVLYISAILALTRSVEQ